VGILPLALTQTDVIWYNLVNAEHCKAQQRNAEQRYSNQAFTKVSFSSLFGILWQGNAAHSIAAHRKAAQS
jgi:hypothetical protein